MVVGSIVLAFVRGMKFLMVNVVALAVPVRDEVSSQMVSLGFGDRQSACRAVISGDVVVGRQSCAFLCCNCCCEPQL